MTNPTIQSFLPQHALSRLAGFLAYSTQPWLKDRLIAYFLKRYPVDLSEALEPNPKDYPSFNAFFTRLLKPEARPLTTGLLDLASPVDGTVSAFGQIQAGQLLQAKGHRFSLRQLLGTHLSTELDAAAQAFQTGSFMTVYLAPHQYHRVHMPIDGHLKHLISIPGRLFSVNAATAATLPGLFIQNERAVCLFETSIGPLAMILVGAMLVGSIETTWAGVVNYQHPIKHSECHYESPIVFKRGEEMGLFNMGSTVIVLFSNQAKIQFEPSLQTHHAILMGQKIGTYSLPT